MLPITKLAYPVIFIAMGVLLSACVEVKSGGDLRVTDDMGDEVRLDGKAETVITLAPSLTEMVFALDAGNRLIACDDASNYPPDGTADIERVYSYTGMNRERIVELWPDLILMDRTLDISGEDHSALIEVGLTVYRVYPQTFEDVTENILDIGILLGKEEEAERLAGDMRERADAVRSSAEAIPEGERQTVLLVTFYDGTNDPWVGTDSTFTGDLISMAGGDCGVKDEGGKVVQITLETMIGIDPDIILTSQSSEWPTDSRELILEDERLSSIEAVKNGRVYDIEGDLIDRSGPRIVDGLETINDIIMQQ